MVREGKKWNALFLVNDQSLLNGKSMKGMTLGKKQLLHLCRDRGSIVFLRISAFELLVI